MKTETKRIEWIDISKGIGILLIIFGHTIPLDSVICKVVFSFHVPLFFFLSGYVAKSNLSFNKLLKSKFNSLVIPFVLAFLFGLIFTLIIPKWRSNISFDKILNDIIYANPDNVHNSSVWFLICLFIVTIVFWVLLRLPDFYISIFVAVIFLAGIAWNKFVGIRLPLNIECVPASLAFYYFGYNSRKKNIVSYVYKRNKSIYLVSVVTALFLLICCLINGYVNLHALQYGDYFVYIIGGLSGTFLTISVSLIDFSILKYPRKILCYYGRHSLIIMCTQSLFIRLYAVAIEELFGRSITLYSYPWKDAVICFLITLALCTATCFLIDVLKNNRIARR